jgi:threonine synthase
VIVPEGRIATGKLAQALMHGARVIALRGNFDDALRLVRELARRHPIALVNSVNDFRIEGQKTAAFEVMDALDGELDALCIPVGNAGNITAYWKGFKEEGARPRMFGFQAAGAAPLVHGFQVEHPETIASAIRIGNPARWEQAMDAMTSSGGAVAAVTDDEILDAYRFLASREGVFCEPPPSHRHSRSRSLRPARSPCTHRSTCPETAPTWSCGRSSSCTLPTRSSSGSSHRSRCRADWGQARRRSSRV